MERKSMFSVEWLTFYLTVVILIVAIWTLVYMYSHDEKADWAEVHKAMISVLAAQRSTVARKGAMGAYGGGPNTFDEARIQFETAATQLRGQLNRLGSEPLAISIGALLDSNRETRQWMSDNFAKAFEEKTGEVAERTR